VTSLLHQIAKNCRNFKKLATGEESGGDIILGDSFFLFVLKVFPCKIKSFPVGANCTTYKNT
jgi:hypothetical protein